MDNRQSATPPHPPYDELRAALGDQTEGHSALDDLHTALHASEPQGAHVRSSVDRLRTIPVLEARIANWWDAPSTQHWLKMLNDAGL